MDIATFHASRRYAHVKSERIAFFERGQGSRVAVFVHGVPLNGYHWRNVIERVLHRRRCIAIDLMGLGYTEIGPSQDVSFTAQAHMIAEVLNALEIEKVDLVGNDSGGAIAQIFAAHHPQRLTSLVLTNCDVHDGWPPPQVLPIIQRARNGTLAPMFQPILDRPDLARERHVRGESVPLFRSYTDPSFLTDDIIRLYLQPLLSSQHRIEAFQRYWLGFDNAHTVAIHSALWSFRSRLLELELDYDVRANVRPVYPIAVRIDGFFKTVNPLWWGYLRRDVARTAEMLGMPYVPPNPDPVVMNLQTGEVSKAQPYIGRLTRLGVAAAERGKGLALLKEASAIIFGGVRDWHLGDHLARAAERAGLDLDELDRDIEASALRYQAAIADNEAAQKRAGHWGVPLMVFENEPFFGQDRFETLKWRMAQKGLKRRA